MTELCPVCSHAVSPDDAVCPTCGFYNGRKVIEVEQ